MADQPREAPAVCGAGAAACLGPEGRRNLVLDQGRLQRGACEPTGDLSPQTGYRLGMLCQQAIRNVQSKPKDFAEL